MLGLYGAAGSGKDAAASHLVAHHGFTRFAFADVLKELAFAIGWDGEKDEKGRKLLQDLGHHGRRLLGADVWVDALTRDIRRLVKDGARLDDIVVTDVRYPNEVKFVKNFGGLLVRIHRPSLDTSAPMYAHPTETLMDSFIPDRVVYNSGTLRDLGDKMEAIVRTAAVVA